MKKLLITLLSLLIFTTPLSAEEYNYFDSPKYSPGTLVQEVVIDENGEETYIVGEVLDKQDNFVCYLSYEELILTPYEEKASAPYQEISDVLDKTYQQIQENNSDPVAICPEIKDVIGRYETLTLDNLVIADLFDVSLYNDEVGLLLEQGYKVKFKVYVDFDESEEYIIIENDGEGNWSVLQDIEYVVDENGNYLLFSLSSLGCLAIIRRGANAHQCHCWLCKHFTYHGYCICHIFIFTTLVELMYIIYLKMKDAKEDEEEENNTKNSYPKRK